jgi:branched-chain amino acid transport system substrate-binding protein
MRADLSRLARLLAVASLAVGAAGCSGGQEPVRIGLLTDCRGLFKGYEDEMLAGAELPLLERGARLTTGTPSGGVSEAQAAGRDLELVRGCTEAVEHTILVEEARRLVEVEGVDAVVGGTINESDSLVLRELARKYPDVVFIPVWSGAQELTLRHPAANVYRFDTDEAQDMAGLGSYAYRELGWRRAAVVTDPLVGWQEAAGFVAEFCALGGNVTARFENSPAPIDLRDPKVARALRGADGVAAFLFGGLYTGPEFLPALSRVVGSPETRLVVGRYVLEDSNTIVPIAHPPAGVVGASSIPPANSTPAMRDYRRAFTKEFPGLPPSDAETPIVLAFNDAMEGLLRGLEASDGDLSDGRRRLREELARVRFDLPSSPVHLDRNRQAVRNTYLKRISRGGGFQLVRVVPGVEQTFGGLLSDAPAPGPTSQPCRKATPPPWVR